MSIKIDGPIDIQMSSGFVDKSFGTYLVEVQPPRAPPLGKRADPLGGRATPLASKE